MPRVDSLAFELERRAIQLKFNTNMPDDTILGFDSDPNTAVNGNTGGETLIYNVAVGATFFQSNGSWWQKKGYPNLWEEIGGTGSTTGEIVSKTIAPGTTELFYTLDLSQNEGFDFTILAVKDVKRERLKMDAMYDPETDSMLSNTYSVLTKEPLNMKVNIYKDGNNCILDIENNEAQDITCQIQLITFFDI